MANIIDGKLVSDTIKSDIKKEIEKLNIKPKLVVILVGNDKASEVYVRAKEKACAEVGIISEIIKLPDDLQRCYDRFDIKPPQWQLDLPQEKTLGYDVKDIINKLNQDNTVDAILCQLPLPSYIHKSEEYNILNSISPLKDVDCFNPINVGNLFLGLGQLENSNPYPCTPAACMELLKRYDVGIEGKHAVIVGRSNIVGKPLAHLLLQNNATVTIAHSKTKNLKEICKSADILCAAVGIPEFIKGDFVKENAVVLDIGINRMSDGKLKGDVAFNECNHASLITPVPKGVGPMTIAMLLQNTLKLYSNKIFSQVMSESK